MNQRGDTKTDKVEEYTHKETRREIRNNMKKEKVTKCIKQQNMRTHRMTKTGWRVLV